MGSELLHDLAMTHGAGIVVGRIGFATVTGDKGRQVAAVRRLAPEEVFPADQVAPELQEGAPASVQSDLYALAVHLRGLFEAERTAYPALAPAPVFHPLPRPYAAFFARATAQLPAGRFRSAREMLLELHAARCEAGSPIEAAWAAQAVRGNGLDWASALPDHAGTAPGRAAAREVRTIPIPAAALSSAYPADGPRRSALLRIASGAALAAGLTGFLVWQSDAVRPQTAVAPWSAEVDEPTSLQAGGPGAAPGSAAEQALSEPSAAAAMGEGPDVPQVPPKALPIADVARAGDRGDARDGADESQSPEEAAPGAAAAVHEDRAAAGSSSRLATRRSEDATKRSRSRPSRRRNERRSADTEQAPASAVEASAAMADEEAFSQGPAAEPEDLPTNPY